MIADHVETMLQDARDRSPHGYGLPRYDLVREAGAMVLDPDSRILAMLGARGKTVAKSEGDRNEKAANSAAYFVRSGGLEPPIPYGN